MDIYSGVGTLGIESLSRGAKSLVSVEKDKYTYKVLQENLEIIENYKEWEEKTLFYFENYWNPEFIVNFLKFL